MYISFSFSLSIFLSFFLSICLFVYVCMYLFVVDICVQMYDFSDPAPTYGNTNFTYMLDFMMYEASKRPTIYHGEVWTPQG